VTVTFGTNAVALCINGHTTAVLMWTLLAMALQGIHSISVIENMAVSSKWTENGPVVLDYMTNKTPKLRFSGLDI